VVWKKQFTYVYGRLYENNGRRTSIRVLRYSLDALVCKYTPVLRNSHSLTTVGQFVLFAFFILSELLPMADARPSSNCRHGEGPRHCYWDPVLFDPDSKAYVR